MRKWALEAVNVAWYGDFCYFPAPPWSGAPRAAHGATTLCQAAGTVYRAPMKLDRITLDPAVMSGKPCIRGLRVTVANVLRQIANRRTSQEILAAYPFLEPED